MLLTREHEEAHQRFQLLADRVRYPGLRVEAWHETSMVGRRNVHCGFYLRISCPVGRCNVSGAPMPWKGRKFRLSQHMTDMEFVGTAFLAILTALEHEARERFLVDGVAIMDSHRDLERTLAFMRDGGGGNARRDEPRPSMKCAG